MANTRESPIGLLGLALLTAMSFIGLWTGWTEAAATWVAGVLSDLILGAIEQQ